MKKSRFKHKKAEIIILSILAVSLIGLGVLVYSAIRANTGNPIINTQDDVPRISAEETDWIAFVRAHWNTSRR